MKNIIKNPYFYLGAAAIVGAATLSIILIERKRKREEIAKIIDILNKNENATGTITDYNTSGSAFDRTYWKSDNCGAVVEFKYGNIKVIDTGKLSVTLNDIKRYAKEIYEAKRGVLGANMLWDNENESIVLSIFRSLKSKCDVSALSDYFYVVYNKDLLDYLKFIDKGENKQILYDLINNLDD